MQTYLAHLDAPDLIEPIIPDTQPVITEEQDLLHSFCHPHCELSFRAPKMRNFPFFTLKAHTDASSVVFTIATIPQSYGDVR